MQSKSQMSHSGHPLLMPPFTTFISLSYLSKTLPHVYIHYSILIYIPQRCLFSPQPTCSFIYPPCPLPLHFHFFCTIYGRILLPLILLITIYHILWTLVASRLLTIPFHALPQPVPLPLIFAFLRLFMDAFLATIILPHHYTSPRMTFEGSIVPGYSIPAPYPCLSP